MLGDVKRDMQQERPYMLNASSDARAEPGSEAQRASGLLAEAQGAPAPGAPATGSAPVAPAGGAPGALSPEGLQAAGVPGADAEPNVSPEEQAQYDKLMLLVTRYVHGQGADAVVERLRAQPDDVPGAIGAIVAELGRAFGASASEAGEPLDDAVLFHAATEAVEQLSEVAEAAGVVPEVNEEMMEQALHSALADYGNALMQSGAQPEGDNAAIAQGLDYMKANGAL